MGDIPRQVKTIRALSLIALSLGLALLGRHIPPSTSISKVHMLNVGQGDSFLIEAANGAQLLIDGGRDEKVLTALAAVMPVGDRSLDVVIATHPDADHIGGIPLILERYEVGLFLTSEVFTDTKTFQTLYADLAAERVPAYYVRRGMRLLFDRAHAVSFTVLFPDRDTTDWETNAASVIGPLDIGARSVLFMGDAPSSIEEFLTRADPQALDVDLLKLGHHGSKNSTGEGFLTATTPAIALISAGVNNRYGHPDPAVLERLKAHGVPWVSTQDAGTVTFLSEGVRWWRGQ